MYEQLYPSLAVANYIFHSTKSFTHCVRFSTIDTTVSLDLIDRYMSSLSIIDSSGHVILVRNT